MIWFCVFAGDACHADELHPAAGRVPPELIERLTTVLKEKAPEVQVAVDQQGGCRFVERCVEYSVHYQRNKFGQYKEASSKYLAPSANGFLLELNWTQALGGGAAGGNPVEGVDFPVYAASYCWLRGCSYKLHGDHGFLYVTWHFGPNTDMTILDLVQEEVEVFGERVATQRSNGWPGKSEILREQVAKALQDFERDVTWRTDGEILHGARLLDHRARGLIGLLTQTVRRSGDLR